MPVNIDDLDDAPDAVLELEQGSQPYRILQFLLDNPDRAFTPTEVHEATGINRNSVGVVLIRLEKRDLVRHEGRYWAIAEDDRLAAYAAQRAASSASVTDDFYGQSN